jgi:probable F420-dependent oxidoreductase
MKFAVAMPGTNHMPSTPTWTHELSASDAREVVATVDAAGYDTITTSEHLGMPYFEVPRLGPWWVHCLSQMAFIAGASERVRIDSTVLVLPYHHPLALAKALSTIDQLSGGRLNVSVGVGHAEQEFAVMGIPFEERGRRTDEILAAMKVLWSEAEPEFEGEFYSIDGLAFEPKPVQRPRPPIMVGGNSKPALRRAARHEGWQPNPTDFTLDDLPPLLDYLRSQPDYAGKEDTFDIFWLSGVPDLPALSFGSSSESERAAFADAVLDGVARLEPHGITRASLPRAETESAAEFQDFLRWFAQDVAPRT